MRWQVDDFAALGCEGDILKLDRKVFLPCRGYLVFERVVIEKAPVIMGTYILEFLRCSFLTNEVH